MEPLSLILQGSALMEAAEPQLGASAPIPAVDEFSVSPEALTSSRQTPAVGPGAPGGQDPSYKCAEGRPLLETQQRDLRDVNDCATKSMTSLPEEAPEDAETKQENLTAEARNTPERWEAVPQSPTDRQAETPAPPELWADPAQGEGWDPVPTSSELHSRVEVEFSPGLAALSLGTGRAEEEEETSPGASAQTRCWPSSEEHPAESHPAQDSESGTVRPGQELRPGDVQGSPGREGLVCPQEAERLEEQGQGELGFPGGGTLGAAVCSDGLVAGLTQVGEQADGTEGGQRQKQEQLRDDGELGLPDHDEWESRSQGQGDPEQAEQRELRTVDTPRQGNRSPAGESASVAGGQEHEGPRGKRLPEEGEEEAGPSQEEPEAWEGATLGGAGAEGRTGRGEERSGPPTLAPVAPGVSSPCDLLPDTWDAISRIAGTQTEPGAEDLSPVALTPALEPVGRSLQAISLPSSFPVGESPDQETAQDSQQEGPKLGEGAASSLETEVASGSAWETPPRTPGRGLCSPAEGPTCTTASPPASAPVAIPRNGVYSPETSRASSLTDQPSLWGASDTLPAPLQGSPAAEASMDPWASPLASSAGAACHPRSSSFPGSHRTQPAPGLAGAPLSSSHLELPQRPPKPPICGSVIPRRDRKSSGGCSSIPESPSSSSIWGQGPRESTLSPERPGSAHGAQPWGSPGLPAYGSSAPLVSADMWVHEPPAPPPPERRHGQSVVERDGSLGAAATLRQCSYPPPLALSSGLHGPPKGPLPEVPDPLVARQYRPLPSTPDSPRHPQTSFSPKLRYNKPLPPTPDLPQPHPPPAFPENNPRIYRPLPAVPVVDAFSEPPPLPPKSRGRNRGIQGGLVGSGGPAKPRPVCQEWTVSTPHSAGRTSWPPATGRAVDSLASTSRSKSEVAPGMAFSNVTALLSPSSPTTPWTLELQEPAWEAGRSDGSRARAGGSLRRTAHQEGANGLRRSDAGQARQPEKAGHPHLEKASSWPHRRDAGRPAEGSGAQAAAVGEGASKHKGWHRQGVRRPSILPEGASGEQGARRPCQTRLCPAPAPASILCPPGPVPFSLPAALTHTSDSGAEAGPQKPL